MSSRPQHALFSLAVTISILFSSLAVNARENKTDPPKAVTAIQSEYFESRVRPLLVQYCSGCHGEKLQSGGLRLDSLQNLLKGGGRGSALMPGVPDKSLIIQAIHYQSSPKMPPSGPLSDADQRTLEDWVKMGAPWPGAMVSKETLQAAKSGEYAITPAQKSFWSFVPVHRQAAPKVKNLKWVKSPIDSFILARLEAQGLMPAKPADRHTLIRRATFDLIGLPPTPEEVDSFLRDKSPSAYSKVVDRLLASPKYGERWGRRWLDVVRYCDSSDARSVGSDSDFNEIWRYRDWVVNALNRDMPYSDFMRNQIAGDLLPVNSSNSSLHFVSEPTSTSPIKNSTGIANIQGTIATGMLAVGNWGNGDADKEKILTDIADDQVDVVSRGFMGLTIACARCHNHKFDPIPTKDYYGLAGIFMSSHILPKLTPKGAGENMLRIPLETPAQATARKQFEMDLDGLQKSRASAQTAAYTEFVKSASPSAAKYITSAWEYAHLHSSNPKLTLADYSKQQELHPYALQQWMDFLGMADYPLMTHQYKDLLEAPGVVGWKGKGDTPSVTINTNETARTLASFTLPPKSVNVHPSPENGVVVSWKSPITGTVEITGNVADADPGGGDGIAWIIDYRTPAGSVELARGDIPNGGNQDFHAGQGSDRLKRIQVQKGESIQILILPKETYFNDTTTVDLTITNMESNKSWNLARDMMSNPLLSNPHPDSFGSSAVWEFMDMAGSTRGNVKGAGSLLGAWREGLQKSSAAPSGQNNSFADLKPTIESAAVLLAASLNKSGTLNGDHSPFWIHKKADETALPEPAKLILAKWDSSITELQKKTPPPIEYANGAQEGGVPESSQQGVHDIHVHIRGSYLRLGDLTPRHFPIILGGMKQPPITSGSGRLQLANWLASPEHPTTARVMVNRIWQGHFGEGIVRTPSNFGFLGERPTHPELLDWLASEFVKNGWSMKKLHREIMLSATYQQSSEPNDACLKHDPGNRLFGRMNRQRLESEAIRDNMLAVSGKLDLTLGGKPLRDFNAPRRTLYIMTIRSDRTGFGSLFDTADPTASMDHRTSTTVAPQALFLMNSSFVLDQVKALAHRLMTEVPGGDTERITAAYRLLFSRPPSSAEIKIGLGYLDRVRHETVALASNGPLPSRDQAAWEAYCQVLVCANEFVFVD